MTNDFGPWGDAPFDGDLPPFTKVPMGGSAENRLNKKHHYIAVTYMNGFTQDDRIWAYRLDAPAKPLHLRPEAIGYENYTTPRSFRRAARRTIGSKTSGAASRPSGRRRCWR
jgi:hypothetical protein